MRESERTAVRTQSEACEFGNDGGSYIEGDIMRREKELFFPFLNMNLNLAHFSSLLKYK